MATWIDLSRDSFAAAKGLLDAGHHRSAASRAYFAVYSRLTAVLGDSVDFGAGRRNPSHGQLSALVRHNLSPRRVDDQTRAQIAHLFRTLQRSRLVADYDPTQTVNRHVATSSVRNAAQMFDRLEAV